MKSEIICKKSKNSREDQRALNYIDCVHSNVQSSRQEALLYVFKLAISVLQFLLLPWQSEFNKNQEKSESQQNREV